MSKYPDDMSDRLKRKLKRDEMLFGDSYYIRSTHTLSGKVSYQRIDPLIIIEAIRNEA